METNNNKLNNKRILLGITGGIAAYKAAELTRLLQKSGADVRIVMTRAATEFITPLTLQALSGKPVHQELLDPTAEAGMGHIELARWADLLLVAPASADFLARLAQGRGDDLLSTVCLATAAPVAVAPAMNQYMWQNPATKENLETLIRRGILVWGPATGQQACGETGPGRMLEADQLAEAAGDLFETGLLQGKRLVITAGPTREALDPVRYLSNKSSGKMGYQLAQAAVDAGATVTLISGPCPLPPPSRLTCTRVNSALEMCAEAMKAAENCDIFIAAAAVADYRPEQLAQQKIKKGGEDHLTLKLIRNPDIIASVAKAYPAIFTVGFAAETEHLLEYARKKLTQKNLDMIVANDVSNPAIGFDSEDNAVTVIWEKGELALPIMGKSTLAQKLIGLIADRLK